MKNRTGELREAIDSILMIFMPYYETEGAIRQRLAVRDQILKACKEKGLMFVDYGEETGHFTEPIEVD